MDFYVSLALLGGDLLEVHCDASRGHVPPGDDQSLDLELCRASRRGSLTGGKAKKNKRAKPHAKLLG